MAAPIFHAESSAKKWGGTAKDYLEIHKFLDSSKATFPDNRHRAITHNSFFTTMVIPRVFGEYIIVGNNRKVSTKDIAEQHVLEDYAGKFIPTVQDFLENMNFVDWMQNGIKGTPNSYKKIEDKENNKIENSEKKGIFYD